MSYQIAILKDGNMAVKKLEEHTWKRIDKHTAINVASELILFIQNAKIKKEKKYFCAIGFEHCGTKSFRSS